MSDAFKKVTDTLASSGIGKIWNRVYRVVWLLIAALAIVDAILVVQFIRHVVDHPSERIQAGLLALGMGSGVYAIVIGTGFLLTSLIFFAASLLLFLKRPDDRMAQFTSIFFLAGVGFAYPAPVEYLDIASFSTVAEILNIFVQLLAWPLLLPFFAVYPDGKFVPRWSIWLSAYGVLFAVAWGMFAEHFSQPGGLFAVFVYTSVALVFGGTVAFQVYRYLRVATPTQKQQIKWMVVALVLLAGMTIGRSLGFTYEGASVATSIWFDFLDALNALLFALIPLAVTAAILRYRLWDLDLLINKSLVYGALTLMLATGFGLISFATSRLLQNQQYGTWLSVGISALLFGIVFQPARYRLQRWVDRTFYHIEIDYQRQAPEREQRWAGDFQQTSLGDYKNLELIGEGGMAQVFRAHHPATSTDVAIKVLPTRLAGEPDFTARFQREARVIASLEHPNIVKVLHYGEDNGVYFMVMELIEGPDLGQYLTQRGALALDEAGTLLTDVASALDFAHNSGLVHRDIKPSNIMIDQPVLAREQGLPPRTVLMDFGIAKLLDQTALTNTGGLLGTFDYIAPEQIRGSSHVDARADVYSLGIVAFQALTGQLPFPQRNAAAALLAHLNQPAPDPRGINRAIPPAVAEAIMRAMAKEPADRYAKAGDFARELTSN